MSAKLDRIGEERDKALRRRDEWDARYKELDKRFAVVHGKRITKKARVEATVLNSLTPISKADICQILPDVSPTTVEAVLGAMVKSGSVKRLGQGRNTRYIKA